ncbi:unnamed protein product [Chrysodeixis includens]|uniref:Uncharacterized protein n=1 Tax=Chrysodeixis includens TaxID=689277 RepID=A0A9P0FNT9_CHRIL|nr:unnamed protein product [Chrysodeixis includens]
MRPPRSRRLRAQRKFPQNAAPPPSAAPAPPAPPANGDRRDNNPEERGNYIIQHQVGPSEFVDYISHQALDSHHHQDFQPRVLLRRLRVPSSTNANTSTTTRTRTRRAELARNRELARSRVTDKNKEQDDKCAETSKNKETKSTETATNKDASKNKDGHKSKAVTFSKDIAKNTSNAKSNHANKETAKSKELVSDKEVKKKDAAKNKSSDKKQENVKNKKSNLHQEKSNTDNPPLSQKHKPTKPVHVMSLRSRRQSKHEFKKKKATKRVTTRLATAKRNIARALEVSTKSEKKMQDASKSTRRHTPKPSSEFSLDDNRPLTYFKNSTPKRAPTATVPRVSLVPLSAATTEPVPGPSGINKKKTNARNQKTKDNLDSSLANITTEPLPSVVTDTVSDSNVARPFYSEPNIYRWMNSSLDDEQSATTSKSNLAPWVSAETQCPALQWRTIKDLNNAEKPELEARCCKCEACNRITKLMRISENLKSHMFLVSGEGDNTPEANKHDDNISSVSTDTTIYLETIPKTPSSVMKIQAHKIHGKKLLSSCVISRTQARQTTDISLLELEMLLDQLNETLSASSQAGESAGGVVMESSYETDSSTSDPLLQPRPTFNTKRLRRQSVCPDQATEGRLTRQRRNSKGAQLALENKAKRLRHISEKASEEHMTRRRRESVWVEQTKEDRPKRQRRLSQRSEPALQDKPRRQRRATVCAEKTTEEQPEVQRLSSECAEVATEGRPTRQRRSSQGAQPALQIKTRRQRRFSEKVTEEHVKRPRQEPVPVEQEPVPVEQEPVPVEQITENRPKRQRRLSQRAELALQDNPKRKRRVSVCAEKLKPKSADSVDLALQDKSRLAAEKPKRRRRDSVCAALALQDNPRLATEEHPKRQRRDSVCAALALQDNPRLATEEHPKRQRRDSDAQP